MTGHHRGLK